jgi:uncharacterized damage-inducible protein DinB
MGKLELVQAMFEYNEWANCTVIDAAARIPAADLATARTASYAQVPSLLIHTLGTQVFWLKRWKGEEWPNRPLVDEGRLVESLREGFARSDANLREFISSLVEVDLARPTPMPEFSEEMRGVVLPHWQVMMQIIEHGIHHRAEVAGALASLGQSTGDLDYIRWEVDRARHRPGAQT